jgi:hypothetical protein
MDDHGAKMNVPIPTISRAISEEQMQRRFEADLKGDAAFVSSDGEYPSRRTGRKVSA